MKKILEILVVTSVLLPLMFSALFVLIPLFMPEKYEAFARYQGIFYNSPYLKIVAVFTCLILALWITVGHGSSSNLWTWMPPFVFFRKLRSYGRVIVVVFLIAGTLIGLMGELFGW